MGSVGDHWKDRRRERQLQPHKYCYNCNRRIDATSKVALNKMPDACRDCDPESWEKRGRL